MVALTMEYDRNRAIGAWLLIACAFVEVVIVIAAAIGLQ